MYRLAIATDPACLAHDPGPDHPDAPWRLESVLRALEGIAAGAVIRRLARPATRAELLRVHTPQYVDRVLALRGRRGSLDEETHLSPSSVDAALAAAGAAIDLALGALSDGPRRGLALVRPPGHHAEPDRALGYCVFSNLALAARAALQAGVRRLAILDLDVHFGNGHEAALGEDPRVLLVSIHQDGLFPTGAGGLEGGGPCVRVPLPPGSGDPALLDALDRVVAPAFDRHRPELVLVGAGFDGHADDPMSDLVITTGGFATAAHRLVTLANRHAGGRIVASLEGGYDPASLAASVRAVADVFAGGAPCPPADGVPSPAERALMEAVRRRHRLDEHIGP